MPFLPVRLRDHQADRDWHRPWRDPPGFLLPNCPCCSGGAQMYSLGGEDTTPAITTTADKTNMSAETTAAVTTANLSQGRWQLASAGNPGIAGYFAGGRSNAGAADVTTTDKLTFSNDTTAAISSGGLSLARAQLYGVSERSGKAYFGGGLSGTGGAKVSTIDKLAFSGDSTSALVATLSQARSGAGGLTEGTSKGYWAGGNTGGGIPQVKTADKISFSSDAVSALTTANLSVGKYLMQSGSDGSTKGYFAGGQTGAPVSGVDKITFSTDTTAAITSPGAAFNEANGDSGSDGNKLLAMGGSQGFGGIKLTFATDSSTTLGATCQLSSSRTFLAGNSTVAL